MIFFLLFSAALGLNNGLLRTPPMGFLSWERFRCNIDCETWPDSCINEQLYLTMADAMIQGGFVAAGYDVVAIDDCWSDKSGREPTGELRADPKRFPNGIKYIADYLHKRGMKLQLYTDIGTMTCGGYPGSYGHYKEDAEWFASQGVDLLKVDGCYANASQYDILYPTFGAMLQIYGPIAYACSWPAYVGIKADFKKIAEVCNMWRAYDDIDDSFDSIRGIASWWTKNQKVLREYQGPGAFNDPDMILLGDFSLSPNEMRTQLALWTIFAAPLLVSADFRAMPSQAAELLLNPAVIAIAQDKLARQGQLVHSIDVAPRSFRRRWIGDGEVVCGKTIDAVCVYTRALADGDLAVAVFASTSSSGGYFIQTLDFKLLNWTSTETVVLDVFTRKSTDVNGSQYNVTLSPHDTAFLRLCKQQ